MPGERDQPDQNVPERRFMLRYPAKASTVVICEDDVMRGGLEAQLIDVSITGVGITMAKALTVGEHVKLKLTNEVQRFTKETRGLVRHVTEQGNGRFQIGIELLSRLTPLEVMLLRMSISLDSESDGQKWI